MEPQMNPQPSPRGVTLSWATCGIVTALLVLVVLAACRAGGAGPVASPTATPRQAAAAIPTPDQAAYREAWASGAHAHTYDLGKGPNTYCARCHAPENWDPAAKVDPAPNCVSCKFATDAQLRVAQHNPPVAEQDWKDIGCEICHPVEDGVASARIAWLNTTTGYHETVPTATALCEKCHTDTETIRHKRDLGTSVHTGFDCTRCHDAHSAKATCTAPGCHEQVPKPTAPVPGHDADHARVTCGACHDAAKLAVGPLQGDGTWVTFRTTKLLGRDSTAVYVSHNLQPAVDCARCHYPNNPWKLAEKVGGAVP